MKPGPSLNKARRGHGCTRIGNDSIIVAGGWHTRQNGIRRRSKSTEILKIGDLAWTNGPDLKEGIYLNEIVKSNGADYIAYSLGGYTGWGWDHVSDKIYGLRRDRNEWQLVDSMSEHRYRGSALNIPSSLIPWCEL